MMKFSKKPIGILRHDAVKIFFNNGAIMILEYGVKMENTFLTQMFKSELEYIEKNHVEDEDIRMEKILDDFKNEGDIIKIAE
jgi:hypothetical protein